MIRALQPEEAGLCVEAGRAFFAEAKLPGEFVPEVFVKTWESYIASGIGAILAWFKGMVFCGAVGIIKCPSMFNHWTISAEAFWYVLPEHRGGGMRLYAAYKKWAAENGVNLRTMVRLNGLNDHLHGIYLRDGMKELETTYYHIIKR